MDLINLLDETKEILNDNGKSLEDIEWIGTTKHYVNKEKALELFDVNYHNGYGAQLVADNLLVVGKDWWLERHEYDGSEWWEMKKMPKKPDEELQINYVIGRMWDTLEEINGGEDNE